MVRKQLIIDQATFTITFQNQTADSHNQIQKWSRFPMNKPLRKQLKILMKTEEGEILQVKNLNPE
jgi:hypothetical protein